MRVMLCTLDQGKWEILSSLRQERLNKALPRSRNKSLPVVQQGKALHVGGKSHSSSTGAIQHILSLAKFRKPFRVACGG